MATSYLDEGSEFLDIDGAILIAQKIFVKTVDSHSRLLEVVQGVGYVTEDGGNSFQFDESHLKHTVRCYHCSHVQDDCTGVAVTHNFPCESCKQPLNVDYERDAEVEFYFVRDGIEDRRQVTLKIFDYNMSTNELLLFPDPQNDVWALHNPQDVLNDNKDRYTLRTIDVDGKPQELISIPVRNSPFMDPTDHIRKRHVSGGKYYFTDVTVFMGVAYDDSGDLPIPMSFSVSTEYMDCKLDLSNPQAHEIILGVAGLSSRTTFYTDDWKLSQEPAYLERMNAFVQHFVNVDYKEWEKFIESAPINGAGFVNALAKWCAKQSDNIPRVVRDETNFMNTVYAAQRQVDGYKLSGLTTSAAIEGLESLGHTFGTHVRLEEVDPTNLMETVKTIIRAADNPGLTILLNPKDGPT